MYSRIRDYGKSGISTSVIAIAVVVIVIIAAAGVYFVTSGGGTSSTSSTTTTTSTSKTTTSTTTTKSTTSLTSTVQPTTTTSTSKTTTGTTAQTTSSTESSTFSCSTTYTSTTGTSTSPFSGFSPLIALFGNYSQMTILFNTTDYASYQVVGTPTINGVVQYEVNYNSTISGQNMVGTAYFDLNGTITQAVTEGTTMTGYQAYVALAAFTPFLIEASFADSIYLYTASTYVHVINQTTVQLGPSSVSVTNYAAPNLPFTISECGYTSTVNKLSLQIGHISGVNYNLLTFADFEGTSQGSSYAFTLQVTSVAK